MINIPENEQSGDTYEHVRALADEQIAKEGAVRDELDATEQEVLEFWDEYIEVPYGRKYTIHICADLSNTDHLKFCKFLDSVTTVSNESDNIFIDALLIITMGIYEGDKLIQETDKAFWENSRNWSTLKVKRIIESYFKHFKEESENTFSFLDEETK